MLRRRGCVRACLVCDDHPMMRSAFAGAVRLAWPEATIATAADFQAAVSAAASRPDLILCDLGMPGAEPLEGVASVMAAAPGTPLLVITAREDDDDLLLSVLDLGVAGFVPKSATAEILEAAMRLAIAGGRYLPPRMTELARERAPAKAGMARRSAATAVRLTTRQMEILGRMAVGQSNKEIARDLKLSPATVKAHAATIIALLGAANRTEAAHRAQALNLI